MSQLKGSQTYIWSLQDVLGQGATGAVYKARHKRTGETYAVKTFNHMSHMRPQDVQMREFDVLQKLKHDNIVRLLAIEEESSSSNKVLVMELCTGGSLYGMLDDPVNANGLEEKEFLEVIKDVVGGMEHLREQGIIHRDIKPGNIMRYIGEDGRSIYKLTDFGAARELHEEEQFMSLYGTEEYLYPDMYERAVLRRPTGKQFDAVVDLWSLGVTFYHVAAGKLPFRPYGGRRNRETMYRITAEKQSGVISGVQHTEHGPVEWNRQLPATCRLSIGAKNMVTPLLAGLMECDVERMWGYDKLFRVVKEIEQKTTVYVFSMNSFELLSIYINKNETLTRIQELIAEQTDIPANNQYLLFENNPFENMVDTMQPAESYPPTNMDNPIFLFQKETPAARPIPLQVPPFPQITNIVLLDTDASLAKNCCGTLHYIGRKISDSIKKQQLISKAAKMFLFALCKDIEQVKGFVTQFALLVEESGKRVQYFLDSHSLNMTMLSMLDRSLDMSDRDESLESDKQELEQLSITSKPAFHEISKGMDEMKRYAEDYYKRIVINKELSVRWKDNMGCMDDDRCKEKIEIIIKAGHEILHSFRKNRSLKRLSYNEEQIHKFEKSKLNSHCGKALSLVQGHCQPSLELVARKFMEWYTLGSKVRTRLGRIERQVTTLQDKHAELAENVDQHQVQHKSKLEEMISNIQKTSSVSSRPSSEPLIDLSSPSSTSDSSNPGSMSRRSSGKPSQKRNTLMKELNNSLMALKTESADVKNALQENADLLKQIEFLSMPGSGSDRSLSST